MTNQIAIITGGSRGLGRNAAIYLAKAGVNSIITYNSNKDAADETLAAIKANGAKGIALQLDTSDVSVFDAFTREITRVLEEDFARNRFDFLLNNAGTGVRALFSETTEEQFDDMMNIHLKGGLTSCGERIQRTTGNLNILRPQSCDHFSGGNVQCCYFIRIEPDAHGIFGRSKDLDIPDPFDTGEFIL